MSTAGAGWRSRDSEADVETSVFRRPPLFGLDRTMVLQIMRDLEPRQPVRTGARALSLLAISRAPNIFLTPSTSTDPPPPWAQPCVPPAQAPTKPRAAFRVVHRRSLLPWFLAVMSFSITFGVLQDPVLRQQTRSQILTAATAAYRYSQGAVSRVTSKR